MHSVPSLLFSLQFCPLSRASRKLCSCFHVFVANIFLCPSNINLLQIVWLCVASRRGRYRDRAVLNNATHEKSGQSAVGQNRVPATLKKPCHHHQKNRIKQGLYQASSIECFGQIDSYCAHIRPIQKCQAPTYFSVWIHSTEGVSLALILFGCDSQRFLHTLLFIEKKILPFGSFSC